MLRFCEEALASLGRQRTAARKKKHSPDRIFSGQAVQKIRQRLAQAHVPADVEDIFAQSHHCDGGTLFQVNVRLEVRGRLCK